MPQNFYKFPNSLPYSPKAISYRVVFCCCFQDADILHAEIIIITGLAGVKEFLKMSCHEMKPSNYRVYSLICLDVSWSLCPSQPCWNKMTALSLLAPGKTQVDLNIFVSQHYLSSPPSPDKVLWINVNSLPGVVEKKMWPEWIMHGKCQNKFQLKMIFFKEI